MKIQFDKVKHTAGTIALGLVMPVFLTEKASFWPKPWTADALVVALLFIGWACGMLSRQLLVADAQDVLVAKKPPQIPPLAVLVLIVLGVLLTACPKPTVAKDEYSAGLKACDDTSSSRAEDDNCKAQWRAKWDEAGAPPAAILDGGIQ